MVSSRNLVWLVMVFLCRIGGEGYPSDLVLEFCGRIAFDSRSGISYSIQFLVWATLVFFWWIGG
jgi:hypothetical protein